MPNSIEFKILGDNVCYTIREICGCSKMNLDLLINYDYVYLFVCILNWHFKRYNNLLLSIQINKKILPIRSHIPNWIQVIMASDIIR